MFFKSNVKHTHKETNIESYKLKQILYKKIDSILNSPIEKKITYGLFTSGVGLIVVPKLYNIISIKVKTENLTLEVANKSSFEITTIIGLVFILVSIFLLLYFNNNSNFISIKNIIKNLFLKKLKINLNEKNRIIDINDYKNTIDLMLKYQLNNNSYKLTVHSKKWKNELEQSKRNKNIEIYNQFKIFSISNDKWIKEFTNILNEFIRVQVAKNIVPQYNIKEVAVGLAEASLHNVDIQNYTKIGFDSKDNKFGCHIFLNNNEVEQLNKQLGISIFDVYSHYGYDMWNLPINIIYSKALPSIMCELYLREKNLNNLDKYMNLNIGIG